MSSTRIHGEEAIIQEFLAPLAAGYPGALGLSDDCATVSVGPDEEIVIKTDPVVAGVHFLPDADPADIAWRALAVNVSDLAAKGAVPLAYVMALALPAAPERAWLSCFAAGLKRAQEAFGCHLIGGDTDRAAGTLTISITVLGRVPRGTMIRRGSARPGDVLMVTGTLGDAALGLDLARTPDRRAALGLSAAETDFLIARYLRPTPRLEARNLLHQCATAAMDLSDGLAKDCGRMCRTSGTTAIIEAGALPLSPAFAAALEHDRNLLERALAGGDDYEILLSVRPENQEAAHALAAAAGLKLTAVGRMSAITEGEATVRIIGQNGAPIALAHAGWDHFQ